MSITDELQAPGGALSVPLALHDAELHLRRRADKRIRDALCIGAELLAGYRAGEIRERLELTADEYKRAHAWLRDAVKSSACE